MNPTKFFHIHSDGYVEEISREKYFQYVVTERNWASRKLVARLHRSEITFSKRGSITLKLKTIKELLEAMPE